MIHVSIRAMNRGPRSFQIAQPVRGVRSPQLGRILVYEGIEYAFDMSADSGSIRCPVGIGSAHGCYRNQETDQGLRHEISYL
jgi:hypothetical protein